MLKIQEYIGLFGSISEANHYLATNLHLDIYEDILQIDNYEMEDVYVYNRTVKSPKNDPIVQEANGLILNEKAEIVSMPFKRMFTPSDPQAKSIDWENAKAQMRYDGTLVVLYNYKGNWFLQTKYRANADVKMRNSQVSVRMAVIEILKTMFNQLTPYAPFSNYPCKDLCYIFELLSPYNQYITPYHDGNLVLLSIFDKSKIVWMSDSWVDSWVSNYCNVFRFMRPREYCVSSLKEVMDLTAYQEWYEKGFIVKDYWDNCMKVENPNYKALEKLVKVKGHISPKVFAKLILNGDGARLKAFYPNLANIVNMFHTVIVDTTKIIDKVWKQYKPIENRKTFASLIRGYPPMAKAVLFMYRRGQIDHTEEGLKKLGCKSLTKATRNVYGRKFFQELNKLGREGVLS